MKGEDGGRITEFKGLSTMLFAYVAGPNKTTDNVSSICYQRVFYFHCCYDFEMCTPTIT